MRSSRVFIELTDAEASLHIFATCVEDFVEKTSDVGSDWGQRIVGTTMIYDIDGTLIDGYEFKKFCWKDDI